MIPAELGPLPRDVRAAWIAWTLKQNITWSWFFTGTFHSNFSREATQRAWKRWIRQVTYASLGARRGRVEHIPWIAVFEGPPRHGANNHVHALIAHTEQLDCDEFRDRWEGQYGFARLEPFDPDQKGMFYVLKNVGFGAELEPSPYFC